MPISVFPGGDVPGPDQLIFERFRLAYGGPGQQRAAACRKDGQTEKIISVHDVPAIVTVQRLIFRVV
jgi:hypothetical protein